MKAIPFDLFKRLTKLTSIDKRILDSEINKMHPNHAKALKVGGLSSKKFPKIEQILSEIGNEKSKKDKKKNRNTHFCTGTC